MTQLSMEAQALQDVLDNAAKQSASIRGFGHGFVHEDMVGGADEVRHVVAELVEAGVDVTISGGAQDRFIHQEGVRYVKSGK